MRRIFIFCLIVGTLLPLQTFAGIEAVTTDRARMRNAPSTINTATILVIPKGAPVTIYEESNGWSRLIYGGKEGWTANWLLSRTNEVVDTIQTVSRGRYISNARVRASGNTTATIVTTLPLGTEVDIIEEMAGWYRIRTTSGIEGFTASWLITKLSSTVPVSPALKPLPSSAPSPTSFPSQDITLSVQQVGTIPTNVNVPELNKYWLQKVNILRRERGLRELVLDQRFVDTASEYAGYMGTTGATNHERADGKTMHQWIDSKNLAFTKRYSTGGWQTNYFTENISWGYASPTTESVKKVLDDAMTMYLNEASYNGAHYRTTYHPDWNTVGVGFYFKDMGNGQYQVFCVFHYGSLVF